MSPYKPRSFSSPEVKGKFRLFMHQPSYTNCVVYFAIWLKWPYFLNRYSCKAKLYSCGIKGKGESQNHVI